MKSRKIRIICCGLGKGFEDFLLHLNNDRTEIVGVIDKNAINCKYPILAFEQLNDIKFDYAVICSRNYLDEIAQALLTYIADERIVAAPNCLKLEKTYQNDDVMEKIMKPTYVVGNLIWGHKLPFHNGGDNTDYVRKATFALVAQMLKKRNVSGDCAEVGVFQGAFARLINEEFPERKLYLFDTFEGFDSRDLTNTREFDMTVSSCSNLFSGVVDTSVQYVLNNMPAPEKCIICKGYFPETTDGLQEDLKFSFVSLDADLYNPIYAGLKYFYSRMNSGGVIMVHDYGSPWLGVSRAVDEFAEQNNIFPIPIPDECGSVLIVHP